MILIELIIKGILYLLFYLSFVSFLFILCPTDDPNQTLYESPVRKFFMKLLRLAVVACVLFLSGFGIRYYLTPTVNHVTSSTGSFLYSDTLSICDNDTAVFFTVENNANDYEPTRTDTCIHCGNRYWRHHRIETESERSIRYQILQDLATNPV